MKRIKEKIICPHCGKEFVIEANGLKAIGFFNTQNLGKDILEKYNIEFGVLKGGEVNGQRKDLSIEPDD